jgi:hypothetical protein
VLHAFHYSPVLQSFPLPVALEVPLIAIRMGSRRSLGEGQYLYVREEDCYIQGLESFGFALVGRNSVMTALQDRRPGRFI